MLLRFSELVVLGLRCETSQDGPAGLLAEAWVVEGSITIGNIPIQAGELWELEKKREEACACERTQLVAPCPGTVGVEIQKVCLLRGFFLKPRSPILCPTCAVPDSIHPSFESGRVQGQNEEDM